MPSVIDELVLKISMDVSALQKQSTDVSAQLKKIRESAETTGKDMEASGKRAAQFFSSAKTEALAFFAILTGGAGLVDAINKTARSMGDLGRAAISINNMNPAALDAWGQALKRIGGNAADAITSFGNLSQALANYRLRGDTTIIPFLNAIGAQTTMTPEQIALRFAEYIKAHPEKTQAEINVMGQGLGLTQSMTNLLREGPEVVAKELALSRELGLRTQEMIDTATKFNHDFTALSEAAEHLKDRLEVNLMPTIDKVVNWLTGWIVANPNEATAGGVGGSLILGGAGSSALARMLGLTGLADAFSALTGIVTKLTGWFGLLLGLHGDTPDTPQPTETWPGRVANWFRRQVGLPPIVRNAGTPGPVTVAANMNLSPDERALLDAIAGGEANANGYASKNPTSSAYGRYQFIDATRNRLLTDMGLPLDTPLTNELQDRMALRLAKEAGWKPGMSPEQTAAILNKIWPSLPGGSQQNTTPAQFAARLQQAARAEASRTRPAPTPAITDVQNNAPKLAGPRATTSSQTIPAWLPDWYRSLWQNQHPAPVNSSSMNSNTTTVGQINIHTAATDANAIAKEIHGAISDHMIAQSNIGLQ